MGKSAACAASYLEGVTNSEVLHAERQLRKALEQDFQADLSDRKEVIRAEVIFDVLEQNFPFEGLFTGLVPPVVTSW